MQKSKRKLGKKLLLTAGILFNVLLIGYYKYFDFFIENINQIAGLQLALRHIVLPLGISFFTFQQLSFLISVYKKEETVGKFIDYFLFISFFPQLVAGPIVLYSEMVPQLKDKTRRSLHFDNIAAGVYIFTIGLFKKVVIADRLALFVDNGFDMPDISMACAWVTVLSYTLQIYFDFSGYSDMAVGLGKLFNIDLPFNFLSPYRSESISEFWRRWHITLGRALSTYIYKPLGGNRKGLFRTCINLLMTFLVSGLWHGAAWTFVIWGLLHGLFCVFERIFKVGLDKIPKKLRIAGTFLIVNLLWVLFRAESFDRAKNIYKGLINYSHIGISEVAALNADNVINLPSIIDMMCVLIMLLIPLLVVFLCKNSAEKLKSFQPARKSLISTSILFFLSVIYLSRGSVFIYFNF